MLNDPEALKDLEQRDGISRSDIEQFVRKYEKPKSAPAGPGREIKVKPGEQAPAKPSPNLPGLNPNTRFSTKTKTDRGSMPQDHVQNNFEDVRFRPPAELLRSTRVQEPALQGHGPNVLPRKRARKAANRPRPPFPERDHLATSSSRGRVTGRERRECGATMPIALPLPRRYLVGFDPKELPHHFTDVLVIGGGIAGFRCALGIPDRHRVLVVTKDEVRESNSHYAQGGIAGVLDPEDRFDNHIADTLAAGKGLCDPEVVEMVVREAPTGSAS